MKFKTYILTIRYNTNEDKPEYIKEELITEEDDVVTIEFDDIDDLDMDIFEDIEDIAQA
jgi:hypothetical protein|tara:strand:- start:492 stop:668 length:177 start_codon:yes stop_codon:yes gene_type:complete